MGLIDDIRDWTRKNGAPVTVLLVVSLVVTSLIFWFTRAQGLDEVILRSERPGSIWSYLTYPWASDPFVNGLTMMFYACLLYWLIQVGTQIEREMGSGQFLILWFAATALAGFVIMAGGKACNAQFAIGGPYLSESAITLVWCVRNRSMVVMLFGFIPVSGFWLGWATVVTVLLLYGASAPVIGVLACVHLGAAALYAADRIPFLPYANSPVSLGTSKKPRRNEKEATTRGQVRYDDSYFDEVKRREEARKEQERLKKLLGDE